MLRISQGKGTSGPGSGVGTSPAGDAARTVSVEWIKEACIGAYRRHALCAAGVLRS